MWTISYTTPPCPSGGGSGTGLQVSATSQTCATQISTTCGNLLDANGNPVHIHGVDLSGTEYACIQNFGIFSGSQNTQTNVNAMLAWHVNFVRIQLNEDCWLGVNTSGISSSFVDTSAGVGPYATAIETFVNLLHSNGIYTEIVDMWNAPGTVQSTGQSGASSGSGQSFGPDEDHSPAMWASMAQAFANDPDTILSPAGEESVTAACMMQGCANQGVTSSNVDGLGACTNLGVTGDCYNVAGLVSYGGLASGGAVSIMRSNGFDGPIALECASSGSTCSSWLTYVDPSGTSVDTLSTSQLLAEPHNYGTGGCTTVSCWDAQYLPVQQAGFPVFYGELGSATSSSSCTSTYPAAATSWADANGIGYMDWTWTVGTGDCFALPADYTAGSSEIPPTTATPTATTTNGSTALTVSSATGLTVGQVLSGSGLPTGDTIISISGTTLTMGLDSTASGSGATVSAQKMGPGWVKAHDQAFVNATPQTNISQGQTTFANSGASNSTFATDSTYDGENSGGCACSPGATHRYQCGHTPSGGSPCYVDVNVSATLPSSCNTSGTCKAYMAWYGDQAGVWEQENGASVYNAPGAFEVDACSSSCTGSPPSSGWTTIYTNPSVATPDGTLANIGRDPVSSVFQIPANTAWLRFYDTSPSPSDASGNTSVEGKVDFLLCTTCTVGAQNTDSWIFLGDSVTDYSMSTQEPSNFQQQMTSQDSNYYPSAQDAGVGSNAPEVEDTSTSTVTGLTFIQDKIDFWHGHYVALDFGGLSDNCGHHLTDTSDMVTQLTYAGFQPVMRYSVTWTAGFSAPPTSSERINQLNAGPTVLGSGTCDSDGATFLFMRYPTLLPGPDEWAFFTVDGSNGIPSSYTSSAPFPTKWPSTCTDTGSSATNCYESNVGGQVHPGHPTGENAYRQLQVQSALFNTDGG